MAYKLDRKALPEDEFKRVGLHQLHTAVAEIDDPRLPRDIVIHQVRKRCKKIRALTRLYRKPLGNKTYRAFNAHYRDLAAPLSGGRDAQAMLDAYDDLMEAFAGKVDRRRFSAVRRQLTLHKQALQKEAADPKTLLADARASLQTGGKAIEDVRFAAKYTQAPEATAAKGLKATYTRARTAMAKALESGHGEDFHEWRKHAKYHWYQCRLLRDYWPEAIRPRTKAADELGELLGKEHDLFVLTSLLDQPDAHVCPAAVREELDALIAARRRSIRKQATLLGGALFLQKPGPALERIRNDAAFEAALQLGDA